MNQCSQDRPEEQDGGLEKLGEDLLVGYANQPFLRFIASIASLTPHYGWLVAALNTVAGTKAGNIANRRAKRDAEEIIRQARGIDESKLDKGFLESEEGCDLLWQVFEKGQRTRHAEKARLYVRILLQAAQGARHRESAEEYINLLFDMNPTDIHLASVLFHYHPSTKTPTDQLTPAAIERMTFSIDPEQVRKRLGVRTPDLLHTYMKRLDRFGLIGFRGLGNRAFRELAFRSHRLLPKPDGVCWVARAPG